MCGICGIVGRPDYDLVKTMCDVMVHRGPDDYGIHTDEYATIGMRRLSIIDVEGGHQPMANETETLWVVSNGEIYNYRDLRKDLLNLGHHFHTHSDTEVIIHSYEEFGKDCVNKFNGMFAFAIWDSLQHKLFIARDRVGIKPIYYWENGNYLVFSSEVKAILQAPEFHREIDISVLYNLLSRLSVWQENLLFKNIQSLKPGHTLTYKSGKLSKQQYWDFCFSKKIKADEEEYCQMVLDGLRLAVRNRMVADVPVGAYLSGGIDSSAIVALMSEVSSKPVKTFCFGFNDDKSNIFDERKYADIIARHFGTEHYEIVLSEYELLRDLPRLIWHCDQPFAGTLPHFHVSQLAKEHVKVALSGIGGDELFGDYGRPERAFNMLGHNAARLYFMPEIIKRGIGWLIALFPSFGTDGHFKEQLEQVVRRSQNFSALYADGPGVIFTEKQKKSLFKKWVLEDINGKSTLADIFSQHLRSTNSNDFLDCVSYIDMKTQLVDEYLFWTDSLSMACSLEARVPFLDHEFIEIALAIPNKIRSRSGGDKTLLKKALKGIMPEEVFTRPKGGFSLPLDSWLKNRLSGVSRQLLDSTLVKKRGLFEPEYVNRLLEENNKGLYDHTYRIWVLMMFEIWCQIYFDSSDAHPSDLPTLI